MSIMPKVSPTLPDVTRAPGDFSFDDRVRDNLAVRIYGRPNAAGNGALVLHFHGGAFVSGDLNSGATVARLLASAGAVVASLDYPLAPSYPFPYASEAGYAALEWAWQARERLVGSQARLFVAGEEAGGNLAAAMALMVRDRQFPPLAGQILLSPMLDACLGTASLRRSHAGSATCRWAAGWHHYLLDGRGTDHPYAIPGQARRLEGLPPTLVLTAADDPFRDEALAYRQRLGEAGVPTSARELEGLTGWPTTFGEGASLSAPWTEPVRAAFRSFLSETGADAPLS